MDVARHCLEQEGFIYALAYRLSQDHLELLFGRIRGMGGYNNNPDAIQLQQAMRRLVLHNFITPSSAGNCSPQDDDDEGLLQIRRPRRRQLEPSYEGELAEMPAMVQYAVGTEDFGSAFLQNCVAYIAGYVCRKLMEAETVRCAECAGALLSNEQDPPPPQVMGLLKVRDNGGLMVPSATTYALTLAAEQCLSELKKCGALHRPNLPLEVQRSVLLRITERSDRLFPGAGEHMFAPRVDECHAVLLAKWVVERYVRVRLFSYGRTATVNGLQSAHLRHNLNKMVLFANQ